MTPQDIINKVYNHFITEGNPRSFIKRGDGNITCQYRSPEGNKCAVGILMSDKVYKKDMEGKTLSGLHAFEIPKYMKEDNYYLLSALQAWHDGPSLRTTHLTSRKHVREFKRIAKRYDCTVPA